MSERLAKAADAVKEDVCSLLCPSHWTGERPPHHPKCVELRAGLSDAIDGASYADLRASGGIIEQPMIDFPGQDTTGTVVYCVVCIDDDDRECVHIFSTSAKAKAFAETDPRPHVLYDYMIDHPERMENRSQ